jgi:acetolactate synthase-1/2/3 large subunit
VDRLRRLLPQLNIPLVNTQIANDVLAYDSEFYIGNCGMKGDRPGNFAVQNADVILSVGCSLHVVTTGYELERFAPDAYKIHVELDPEVLKRENVGVDKSFQTSVQTFLSRLEERMNIIEMKPVANAKWHDKCQVWKRELAVMKEPHQRDGDEINYYDFVDKLSDACTSDESLIADAGTALYAMGQAFRSKEKQRVHICGALGQMGYSLPGATGAAVASPEKTIVAVTGDGSYLMNMHELGTIAHNELNVKVFVVNNGGYVSIRNTQNYYFGGHLAGTEEKSGISTPNFEKIAEAYSVPYFRAENRTELPSILEKAMATPGPVFCEIIARYDQQIVPSVSSKVNEDGTMESMPLHNMSPFLSEEDFQKYSIENEK